MGSRGSFPKDLGECVRTRACVVCNSHRQIDAEAHLNKGGVMRKPYQETKLHETSRYQTDSSCVELFESGRYFLWPSRFLSSSVELKLGIPTAAVERYPRREDTSGITSLEKYLRAFLMWTTSLIQHTFNMKDESTGSLE